MRRISKKYRLIINVFIVLLVLVLGYSSVSVKASAPYVTRTVDRYGEIVETQGAYDPVRNIKSFEHGGVTDTFNNPQDMFIDIDDFKLYNDKYGHTVGNEVLIGVANKLNEVPHALSVRWGGDEFAIVERNLTRDEFIAKANYLLKSVEGLPHKVTISIGLSYYVVGEDFEFQKIFNEADLQAIRAKGKGKNCIVIKD